MPNLEGKVALVTGGSKGIGRAIAKALCEAGSDVVVCSRNADEASAAAEEIDFAGEGRATGVRADVCKLADVKTLVDDVVREFGGLDILVANAGIGGGFGPVDEIEPDAWSRVIDTNL
ncbi:MAG: SDR family NAD(P)-dependent oxidoreductase, partial [Gemmatimonadota bacterium]